MRCSIIITLLLCAGVFESPSVMADKSFQSCERLVNDVSRSQFVFNESAGDSILRCVHDWNEGIFHYKLGRMSVSEDYCFYSKTGPLDLENRLAPDVTYYFRGKELSPCNIQQEFVPVSGAKSQQEAAELFHSIFITLSEIADHPLAFEKVFGFWKTRFIRFYPNALSFRNYVSGDLDLSLNELIYSIEVDYTEGKNTSVAVICRRGDLSWVLRGTLIEDKFVADVIGRVHF